MLNFVRICLSKIKGVRIIMKAFVSLLTVVIPAGVEIAKLVLK